MDEPDVCNISQCFSLEAKLAVFGRPRNETDSTTDAEPDEAAKMIPLGWNSDQLLGANSVWSVWMTA